MKNMRLSYWLAMSVLAMVLLAGCSNGKDNNNADLGGTTSQTQESTSAGTAGGTSGAGESSMDGSGAADETDRTTNGETGGAGMTGGNGGTSSKENDKSTETTTRAGEESGGVIDGLIDDVEKGVDDLTGEPNGESGESR